MSDPSRAPQRRAHLATAEKIDHDIRCDGNLYWCPTADAPADYLAAAQARGWDANSRVGDPRFIEFKLDATSTNDYRLQPGSPAIGGGIVLPANLEDPLRPQDGARPDIGALPAGDETLKVGIHQRIVAGMPEPPEDP